LFEQLQLYVPSFFVPSWEHAAPAKFERASGSNSAKPLVTPQAAAGRKKIIALGDSLTLALGWRKGNLIRIYFKKSSSPTDMITKW
jgi:hypothetical protein